MISIGKNLTASYSISINEGRWVVLKVGLLSGEQKKPTDKAEWTVGYKTSNLFSLYQENLLCP